MPRAWRIWRKTWNCQHLLSKRIWFLRKPLQLRCPSLSHRKSRRQTRWRRLRKKSTPRRVNWLLVMARELWMEPKSRRLCQRLQWITPILQRWLRHLSTSPWFSKSQSSLVAGQLSCNGLPRTSNIRNQPRMPRYKARWSAPLLLIRMARCAM